jgi:hypothetical protein
MKGSHFAVTGIWVLVFAFRTAGTDRQPGVEQKPGLRIFPGNQPPRVEILKPGHADFFTWDSEIPYAIRVTDPEDGDSDQLEILPPPATLCR